MAKFIPSPESFLVEEIPAYTPTGSGEHTFLFVEKRLMTTFDAVNEIARQLAVAPREIGYAGMKDRAATTRQWLSVPRVAPEAALAAGDGDRLRVLIAEKHGNKLRIGHLKGNRFETRVIDLGDDAGGARITANLAVLAARGLANRYGDQRFGNDADNAARGIAVLRGQTRERDHRRRRLLLSATQAAVFNRVLDARQTNDQLRRVLTGDVLQKIATGGVFITDDPATDQARLDAGEIVVTGPMPGGWAREPPPDTEARAIEDAALADLGVTRAEFSAVGRDLPGTRRPFLVPVTLPETPVVAHATADVSGDAHADGEPRDAITIRFELPAGTYATVLLQALGVTVDARPARAPDSPSGLC